MPFPLLNAVVSFPYDCGMAVPADIAVAREFLGNSQLQTMSL